LRVLVIAAHPDDEVLGCGGTLALLAQEGHETAVTILGEGVTSRYPTREAADEKLLRSLQAQSREVAEMLGAREVRLHNLPDNRFDTMPLLEVVKLVEGDISDARPDVVYTHHGGDLNIDHRITHQAVLTATRPLPGQRVREVYAFEVPSSTEWSFQRVGEPFRPNAFRDISSTLELKLKALSTYESEVRAFPHPRSLEAIEAIAKRWGSTAGCAAAEAFELVRSVPTGGSAE
jgi:LmbE family N-acetylglucosaminyl deacetylase